MTATVNGFPKLVATTGDRSLALGVNITYTDEYGSTYSFTDSVEYFTPEVVSWYVAGIPVETGSRMVKVAVTYYNQEPRSEISGRKLFHGGNDLEILGRDYYHY